MISSLHISHLNTHSSPEAGKFLNNLFKDSQINFLFFINEPSRCHDKIYSLKQELHFTSNKSSRAIIARPEAYQAAFLSHLSTDAIAIVEIKIPNFSFYFISAYLHPKDNISLIVNQVTTDKPLINGTDSNCRSEALGDTDNNSRGAPFIDCISFLNLQFVEHDIRATFLTVTNGPLGYKNNFKIQ